jgi:large subunit ribosomal protein L4
VKKVARRSALVDKLLNNKVIIVEDFTFDAPKTKELVGIFSALKATRKTTTRY